MDPVKRPLNTTLSSELEDCYAANASHCIPLAG